MRTTVAIPDDLLRAARLKATEEGRTLSEVVVAGLRALLHPPHAEPFRIRTTGGKGVRPGVPLTSNAALAEYLDALDARDAG